MWNLCRKQSSYALKIESFIHQNPQRCLSFSKLTRILVFFEKWWINERKKRSEHFGRFALHYIGKRAFWSDIKDGDFVAKFLKFLHQADKGFKFFMYPEADFYPQLTGFKESPNRPVHFFLDHAYREKLTIRGLRIADMKMFCGCCNEWVHPCEMSIHMNSPFTMQLLLQYGALIDDAVSTSRCPRYLPSGNVMALYILLIILLAMIEQYWAEKAPESMENELPELRDLVQFAEVIMRVIPQIPKELITDMYLDIPESAPTEDEIIWITEIIPEIKFRIYCPMSLKHACRLTVRNSLHNNRQLPRGIEEQNIPETMKGYINLCY